MQKISWWFFPNYLVQYPLNTQTKSCPFCFSVCIGHLFFLHLSQDSVADISSFSSFYLSNKYNNLQKKTCQITI